MHSLLITISLIAAVALIHFSWVDFRFRYREGPPWNGVARSTDGANGIPNSITAAAGGRDRSERNRPGERQELQREVRITEQDGRNERVAPFG